MSVKHALLSASSAHKWIACPPSALLSKKFEDTSSSFAQEGTDAHTLAQYKLEKLLGLNTKDPTESLSFYDEEMNSHAEYYAAFVIEQLEKARETCADPQILIEQKLDFSKYVPEGYGHVDCLIISDGTLTVIDYKYGLGIKVSAERNPQMFCYALGGLALFDGIYDIDNIHLIIYQPRRENISEYSISKSELIKWAEEVLTPTAQLAIKGEGEYKAGEHCQFCKAKATCRKRAEYNLELAKYDFEVPATLDNDEIAAILTKADELVSWANDVKEYALKEALNGTKFEGFKLVAGRSNRKYTDEAAVADVVIAAGKDPYEKKLLGITAMTALLGKKVFEDILGGLTFKPPGKPVLVTADDKRPEYNSAFEDFDEN
ncbi:MAG: nuclease [Gracilibacter sp. BRH_c7a]|nr:MAG: nuclease [Gracilibacter sp. BRH_c7a]